ncbi:MAG: HRDC domain-containing protein [Odoribacter sp.]|nr:HRDC domain-containing protein [Odoribacter sp.]
MQYEVFTIPVLGGSEESERMNRFLRGHKVVQVDRQFLVLGDCAYWSFCVNYLESAAPVSVVGEKREKVDYKNVLSEEHFKVFSQLRAYRKQIAEQDAVPAYAVFTDAELALLAQSADLTEQSMLKIDGIGKKRVEKYGALLIELSRGEVSDTLQNPELQNRPL